jgi:hypothetical protein
MYLLFSIPSKCLFLWTGRETDIAIEHGLFIPPDANPAQSAIVKLEKSFGKSQSYFLPLSEFVLRVIILTQKTFAGILRGHHSIRTHALPIVIWSSVLAIFLYTSVQYDTQETKNSENESASGNSRLASQPVSGATADFIMKEIRSAFASGQPYAKLRTDQPGVTELPIIWPQKPLRNSYAVIPGYSTFSTSLALSIETPFKYIFVYVSSGKWEMRIPSRICNGALHYQMHILDKFALAFEDDRTQPSADLSIAQIPPNHSAVDSCHSDLMEDH